MNHGAQETTVKVMYGVSVNNVGEGWRVENGGELGECTEESIT